VLLVLLAGCASISAPPRSAVRDPAIQACDQWFAALNEETRRAGVRDAGAWMIPAFPYLRADRYTASFGAAARRKPDAAAQWVERMRALDQEARTVEIANLPAASLDKLEAGGRGSALARTQECGRQLMAADAGDASLAARLADEVRVPDDYLTWQRALGLYPIIQYPFSAGVEDWHDEARKTFERARAGEPANHEVIRYAPVETAAYSRAEVAALLRRAPKAPLGVPQFSPAELGRLFATYAPDIEVETTGDYDRIGALHWRGSEKLAVDPARPVVYRKLAYARQGEATLVQLVYVAWFAERPKDHAFDLLGGQLDGLVWRVTLAPDGEPVLYDTIHPCGCFHMFFPTPRAEVTPPPKSMIEWAFVPATLPAVPEGARIAVQAMTRSHYLRDVRIDGVSSGSTVRYTFEDYDGLRSLPRPDGSRRSAFAPNGLVPGTQRSERFLFWPMGVPSAGAMRQWGRHATAFLGRRHFDDADLIERRFVIRPPG
jgi:hypothetical protein